ncbi:unnamed protein product [Lampetra fluviatilis]
MPTWESLQWGSGPPWLRALALGAIYVSLSSSRVLLIKLASTSGGFEFLPASVNLAAEALKLLVCLALTFIREARPLRELCSCVCSVRELALTLRWSLPGLLYCVDNLVAFYIVALLNPAVAVLLGNFVIVTTALLFRVILKRHLSSVQWAIVAILFLAIVGLGMDNEASGPHRITSTTTTTTSTTSTTNSSSSSSLNLPNEPPTPTAATAAATSPPPPSSYWHGRLPHPAHALVLLQCIVASAANVYNEKIFKERVPGGGGGGGPGTSESIFLQSTRLYGFGVAFNAVPLVLQAWQRAPIAGTTGTGGAGWLSAAFGGHGRASMALVAVTAMQGLVVAFILKFRDNMFHVLAAQMSAVTVAGLSAAFFAFRPGASFLVHAAIVPLAVFAYARAGRGGGGALAPTACLRLPGGTLSLCLQDGEELECLTKPRGDDSDSDSL